jgi:Ca-activated chloride channel family protein
VPDRRVIGILSVLFGAFLPALGAQTPAPEAGTEFVFRAETRLVLLHASVLDRQKNFVPGLTQAAFRVYENNVEQTLKVFRREDVPVSIGLVIDNSGSMRSKRERVNAAALAFVEASNPADEAFLLNFNDRAFLDQDFTSDPEVLREALKNVDQLGGTAFYDALSVAIDHVNRDASRDKKAIILITDGEDNDSRTTLDQVLRKLEESEVAVFTVGLLHEEQPRAARRTRRALTEIAQTSGGAAFFPHEAGEVDEIARRIALDIRNQYILGYTPADTHHWGFRRIHVTLEGVPRHYRVRTRTGYFFSPAVSETPPVSSLSGRLGRQAEARTAPHSRSR